MANIKANEKSIEKQLKAKVRNAAVKSRTKTAIKKVTRATEKDENITKNASLAIKELDKAVSKGVLHKNNAARRKARMLKHLDGAQPVSIKRPVKKTA